MWSKLIHIISGLEPGWLFFLRLWKLLFGWLGGWGRATEGQPGVGAQSLASGATTVYTFLLFFFSSLFCCLMELWLCRLTHSHVLSTLLSQGGRASQNLPGEDNGVSSSEVEEAAISLVIRQIRVIKVLLTAWVSNNRSFSQLRPRM